MEEHDSRKAANKANRKQAKAYLRYSGLAIQMGVVIAFFAWLGQQLDEATQTAKPYWTTGMALLGVGVALYFLIVDVLRQKNSDDPS